MTEKQRVQFDFSPEALKRLDTIKEKTGASTRAEAVRMALRAYEWLVDEIDSESVIKVFNKENEEISALKAKLLLT